MDKTEEFKMYGGNVKLTYNDKKHLYTASIKEGKTWSEPKKAFGVTSIVGVTSKPFLTPWSLNCMRDRLKADQKEMGWKVFAEDFSKIIERSKGESDIVGKIARELGTRVHNMAERWQTKGADHTALMIEMLMTESEDERNSYTAMLKFFNEHTFEPKFLEKKCFSLKYGYAGTDDYYGKIDDKITVMDYKTSKAIYEEYPLQVSAYANALIEEGYPVDQIMIVRLGKDGVLETRIEEDPLKYFEEFLACKKLYEYKMSIKGRKFGKSNKK